MPKTHLVIRIKHDGNTESLNFFKKTRVRNNVAKKTKAELKDEVKEFKLIDNPSYKKPKEREQFRSDLITFLKAQCLSNDTSTVLDNHEQEWTLTFAHNLFSPHAFTWEVADASKIKNWHLVKQRHKAGDDAWYNSWWIAGNELIVNFIADEVQQLLWFTIILDVGFPFILTPLILLKYSYDLYKAYQEDNEGLPLTAEQKIALRDQVIRMAFENFVDIIIWVGLDVAAEELLPFIFQCLKVYPTALNPLAALGLQAALSIMVGIVIGMFTIAIIMLMACKQKYYDKDQTINLKQEFYDSLKFGFAAGLSSALWYFLSILPGSNLLESVFKEHISATLISTFLKTSTFYLLAKLIGFDVPKALGAQKEEEKYNEAKDQKFMLSGLSPRFFCCKPSRTKVIEVVEEKNEATNKIELTSVSPEAKPSLDNHEATSQFTFTLS